ncbi:U3 small nucleolar RNA-associated protein 6 [Cocos nucifera]|uniref:U3 small nucleolar RNA-associated protein 6 n=1 Tax=Cocos nucifera TaxID=13894 RepID=A0A8K0ICM9_COCNU|nr:U3 small nucleolar RNA-associated protein 6 [Cocos nucifera]
MADVVQFRMERMADELDDLERRGLFSRAEIAEIVRRRRDYEYRLKRPSPLKQDFLAYIEYEKQLDDLRSLRKRAILGELRQKRRREEEEEDGRRDKTVKWNKSISDVAGVRRILDIYRMAVVRYKGDLDLWFRYLEFCRERKHGRMKKALVEAIRFHPKVPGLWIYAAAWEFDQNLNVAAARALMQSGLRACPKSEDLWIEYLRMELTYLNKLKARKVALGEDVKTLEKENGEGKQWKEENEDLFMPLNEERGDAEGSDLQEGALEKKENLFWQQGSMILQTIYHGAVEALPSSMSLRKRFLDILDSVDLAHSDDLKIEVMEDFKKDFSHDENYWDWIARLQLSDSANRQELKREVVLSKLDRAVQVFEEALKVLSTTKMYSLYAKFWLDVIFPDREDSIPMLSNCEVDALDFSSSILKVYENAESSGCLTEDLACQYISFYLQTGRSEEARNLSEKLSNGKFSGSANLWVLRSSMEMKWLTDKSASISMDELHSVFELLKNVLTRLSLPEAECLWLMALKFFSNNKDLFQKLLKYVTIALARAGGTDSGFSITSSIVNWVLQRDGIEQAREMYKRFLALPHPSLKFFKHCIELESNLCFVGDGDALRNARKLYELAIAIYAQNRELWKEYYIMERKVGTSETANAVYWRARKILKDTIMLSVPSDL